MTTNTSLEIPRTAPPSIASQYLQSPTSTQDVAIRPDVSANLITSVRTVTLVEQDYLQLSGSHPVRSVDLLQRKTSWRDREYREAYADAAVEQGVAWQVRTNREGRSLTQKELARLVGTKQSAISRTEDPEYGSYSIPMLQKIAHAFDCALIVKFAPYSVLARESASLSPHQLFVKSYVEEMAEVNDDGDYQEQ